MRSLPIAGRLAVIVAIAVAGLIVLALIEVVELRSQMYDGRETELTQVVDSAYGIVAHFADEERAGRMDRASAQQAAQRSVRAMRYGADGSGYVWINDFDGIMLMHPVQPQLERTDMSDTADPNGFRFLAEAIRLARTEGAGTVNYLWPKPGMEQPVGKMSRVRASRPGAGCWPRVSTPTTSRRTSVRACASPG